jgi:dTDP-4-dehydrorhamnose 3,5-epimerase-like enzyme
MMVTVKTLDKIGESERGATHYFSTDRTGQFIVAYRKAGSVNGQHYHKGTAVSKNPEQFILMQGEATINWFDVRSDHKGSVKIVAPALVCVEPWAWHEVIADTNFVMFELNGLEDAKEDTFRDWSEK